MFCQFSLRKKAFDTYLGISSLVYHFDVKIKPIPFINCYLDPPVPSSGSAHACEVKTINALKGRDIVRSLNLQGKWDVQSYHRTFY